MLTGPGTTCAPSMVYSEARRQALSESVWRRPHLILGHPGVSGFAPRNAECLVSRHGMRSVRFRACEMRSVRFRTSYLELSPVKTSSYKLH